MIIVYIPFSLNGKERQLREDGNTMSESTKSPLARLVLFIVCLSVLGSAVAGAHYYAVDLPQQQQIAQAPENYCIYTYGQCKELYNNYRWYKICCYKDCCTSPADCEIT
jgi:hypothetical protein